MPNTPEPLHDRYSVLLPCTPETFADFVSGLLGAPQTIERRFFEPFELRLRDIENTFHLVDQRIRQQNEASLLQFAAKIQYEDNSSVLLASLPDLLHYNEVRPVVSDGVHLTWVYLVRFPDKAVPEKQQIDLTFRAGSIDEAVSEEFIFPHSRLIVRTGGITFRIAHTARSWGVDLESLLTNHLHSLHVEETPGRRLVYRNSGKIALLAFVLTFLTLVMGSYATIQHFNAEQIAQAGAQFSKPIPARINYVIQQLASGSPGRGDRWVVLMCLVSLVIALLVAMWIISLADSRHPSFVLLSRQAEVAREKALRKRQRKWLTLLLSLVVAVLTGVTGNWIFAIVFRHFH